MQTTTAVVRAHLHDELNKKTEKNAMNTRQTADQTDDAESDGMKCDFIKVL